MPEVFKGIKAEVLKEKPPCPPDDLPDRVSRAI